MLNTLKATWGRNRTVIGNFFTLSVVQFANYLVPLILIPYLTRVLGLSRYGLVELARAVSVYFLLLTDYGFSLSATREVSVHRNDPKRLSEVFSSVMTLKCLLVLLSTAVLSGIVFTVPRLRPDWPVYYLSFASVLGMWLFPMWLFQGMERMKPIAVVTVVAKSLVVVATVLFVRDPDDYLYVPLLHSGGNLLIGLAGLAIALRSFPIRFRLPSAGVLWREFMDGRHVFASRISTTLYTTSNVVILGLFADNVLVAYFAAGEKIVRAATDGLMIPLSQAIFPHIGRLASQSKQAALRFAARVAGALSIVTAMISAALLFGAPYIAQAVLDEDWQGGALVIRILSFLPFIIGLSNVFGVQIMVNFGLQQTLTRILTAAGLFNLIVALSLVVPLRHAGVAVATLLTEVFVTTTMFVSLRRSGLDLIRSARGGGCDG
ncbi:MAG: flippase [Phycisphaerae bacterium]|nr:flippase [Phycisphaerae bacterium]